MILLAFTELDTESEKILKLLLKHDTLNMSQISVLMNKNTFDFGGYMVILINKGYIQNSDIGKANDKIIYADGVYHITTSGKVYFDLKQNELKRFVMRSIYVPIGIAIVVSIITTLITLWLKSLW